MSKVFNYREFSITQDVNPHKTGTDSMLLGAWTKTDAKRILDIGTGTGVLALMMAQNHPNAEVTAIEIREENLSEARLNFENSKYADRILAVHSPLQQFGAIEKYDLIICNPPYYDGTFLAETEGRNIARQSTDLQTHELYEGVSELLDPNGLFNLIFPIEQELEQLRWAAEYDLHPIKILRTRRPNGDLKRCLFSFGFDADLQSEEELVVRNAHDQFSPEYVELTKEFHDRELPTY